MIRRDADLVARHGPRSGRRLRGAVTRTPALASPLLNGAAGCRVVAKAESLQRTGSFKVRGALNRVRSLSDAERAAGLITISAGNAALGAAHAAREHGARLTVVCPRTPSRRSSTRWPRSARTWSRTA